MVSNGTFKQLIVSGLTEAIKRNGKELAFSSLRKSTQGTGFEECVEELYNEMA